MIVHSIHPGRGHGRACPLDQAKALVDAWRASAKPISIWCREQGILRSALHSYMRRLSAPAQLTRRTGFIQLKRHSSPPVDDRLIRVTLGISGATAEVSLSELTTLIRSLSEAQS
jgi:hypothetical protein